MFFPSLRPVRRPASRMFPPSRRPVPKRKALGFRPGLEALEARWVPTTVTNLNDAGSGSLRQAILDTPSGGTVDFQPGLSGTISLTTGELTIDKNLTVAGPGASVLTVSGNNASRVFNIAATFTVALSGLTIANGRVDAENGGGILNAGALTVTASTLSGNSTTAAEGGGGGILNTGTLTVTASTLTGNAANSGGGIGNYGALTVTTSTLSGNSASDSGGGIFNNDGALTVTASTLSGNSATVFGGGIYNWNVDDPLTVTASTLSGNTAGTWGGGIFNATSHAGLITTSTLSGNSASAGGGISNYYGGTLVVMSSTISGNHSTTAGGGIDNLSYSLSTRNTIVAGNTGTLSPDVRGSFDSWGHNLIGDGTGGSGFHPTDLVGTAENPIDPRLGPLAGNGGPTLTHALLPGSPALDTGDNTDVPDFDQRGPGFPRAVGSAVDIGAFEAQPTRTWVGGAYLDVCAGTQSGDPNAWSNPLNWLGGGVPGAGDNVVFADRVLVAECSGTYASGPFTTGAVVDATFAGTVSSLHSTWAGSISLARDLTLTGPSVWSRGIMAGGTLTNAGSLTVSGGSLTGNLRNGGAILLGSSGSAESFLVNGNYTQSGALLIGPDSTFRVTGSYTQEAGGITYLVYGILTAPTIDLAAASTLAGSGTLNGNVRNAGYVFVGNYGAAGYLIVNGDYTQTSTGWLFLELGSLAAADYDVMAVTGTASLEGVLYVSLLPTFTPEAGAGYAVLWFGARGAGEPAVYLPDLGPDYYFEAEFGDAYLALWLWPTA